MADQATSLRDNHQAIQHNLEAQKYASEDVTIKQALARLYMQVRQLYQRLKTVFLLCLV